ncbi:uncharacterized protein LOC121330925 isoform X3 [Polyodon spathula]|uniref:uncharacterized protein LOC121330925 isoform X3 n=1 Tax=Polyodon spathula TaxID=7913 RepID=UPI001B7F6185|nr:uncharacterized protein LOC121330925 isoform X3 [Polyodon spathula]
MADPLRRTLLAKLRGKKSKKGTTAGTFSVAAAANGGNREGKEKVLQLQQGDEQQEQARVFSSAGGVSVVQNTMWVKDSCLNGDFDVKREVGLLRESVVVGTAFSHCETLVHPINRRGNVHSSEEFHFSARVNEQLLGVSLRDAQANGSQAGTLRNFNEQDPSFMRLAIPGSLDRPEGQKQIPRQYSGDSIGFGICENRALPGRASSDAVTAIASTSLTGGQYLVSENKNMGNEKDHVTRGDETDFPQQSDYDFGFMGNCIKRTEPNFSADCNINHETDVQVNGTQMYRFAAPTQCLRLATGTLEESSLIKNTGRYVSGLTCSREYSAVNLRNPAFFPIDLENLVPSLACQNCTSLESREGIQRHNSIDSEGDDYYDNETLPCYEPDIKNYQINNNNNNTSKDTPISSLVTCETVDGFGKGANDSAEETDRLRTQLNEAYYLLINAMQDTSIDNQPGSNRFCDDLSTPSCHSQDSVCTHSSVRALDSDAWSSGDSPPNVSDTDSLHVNHTEICNASAKRKVVSKSVENISVVATRPPLLQRTVSAGDIKYAAEHALGSTRVLKNNSCQVSNDTQDGETEMHDLVPETSYAKRLSSYDGISSDDLLQAYRDNVLLNESNGSVTSSTGSSDTVEAMGSKIADCNEGQVNSAKPLGVTVNKMQQWMHKGRLLSSEMKQRISGSSLRGRGSSRSLRGQAVKKEKVSKTSPDPPSSGGQGSIPGSSSQTILQTVTGPTDGTYTSDLRFSPPSSPNPLKKGGSINWSFPDKIKSPRTVRKLSMKMKKLPELSRKLSVKGTSSSSHPEPQPASPKSNESSSRTDSAQGPPLSPGSSTAASRNVISRYHLDSSVSTQHSYKKKNDTGGSKSASKGGYLSDGDSPELVTKSGSKAGKSKEPPTNSHKVHVTEIDIDAFRHYNFADKPKCSQYISGLMSVHFYGAEDLKPPRIDSREVYCAIQVDSVNKARTALLTCKTTFLDMDHTFNIELENAQHLKLVVFSWEPTPRRNRVCCHGTVVLPTLFRVTRTHQLAVKLEPRGKIYVKLNLMEQWQNSLDSLSREQEHAVFGVEAWKLVEKENAGIMVPLLIEKCITEIENRGCQVVGLYRLCGSAAVKKELREAFERDSKAVELSENQYPDINVITGVLKDYLRELPFPLITKQLYEAVLDAMVKRPLRIGPSGCENEPCDSEYTVSLLEHLPEVEKVTLRMLLDHLKRVASYHEVNKMNCQNLAVCFGPVLLSQRQEASHHSNRVFIDSEELASALDFKKHIEVLHYLLQLWPVVDSCTKDWLVSHTSAEQPANALCLRRRQRPQPCMLDLSSVEMAGVLRPRQGRLDSSSNRYARDWSTMGESYFQPPKENTAADEADYDDVPSEQPESEEEVEEEGGSKMEGLSDHIVTPLKPVSKEHTYQAYMKIQEINPALNHPVNLKDLQESIDTLIGNLERELNKNKLNVGY